MTQDQLIERMEAGDVRLVFDTNAVEKDRRFHRLCDNINRLNSTAEWARLSLHVSAAAHAEKLFHLKQKIGDGYNVDVVMESLQNLGVQILAFDQAHANAIAEYLGQQFQTREAWRQAKRRHCLHCLHVQPEDAAGNNCSATIDWLIAGHAIAERCILVTDDGGPEFHGFTDKIKMTTLEGAIERMLAKVSDPSPSKDSP